MNTHNHDVIISGVHLDLTDALKTKVLEQMTKLFNHEERIIRIRVELEFSANTTHENEFIAKGYVEVAGPPMVVQTTSNDLYESIDMMYEKLARMIRRRHRLMRVKRKHPHGVDVGMDIPKAAINFS